MASPTAPPLRRQRHRAPGSRAASGARASGACCSTRGAWSRRCRPTWAPSPVARGDAALLPPSASPAGPAPARTHRRYSGAHRSRRPARRAGRRAPSGSASGAPRRRAASARPRAANASSGRTRSRRGTVMWQCPRSTRTPSAPAAAAPRRLRSATARRHPGRCRAPQPPCRVHGRASALYPCTAGAGLVPHGTAVVQGLGGAHPSTSGMYMSTRQCGRSSMPSARRSCARRARQRCAAAAQACESGPSATRAFSLRSSLFRPAFHLVLTLPARARAVSAAGTRASGRAAWGGAAPRTSSARPRGASPSQSRR
jgi:hypothetical protein